MTLDDLIESLNHCRQLYGGAMETNVIETSFPIPKRGGGNACRVHTEQEDLLKAQLTEVQGLVNVARNSMTDLIDYFGEE